MHQFHLGFDEIVLECDDILAFLKQAKYHHLHIYHLKIIKYHTYKFYVPIYMRHKTYQMHLPIKRSIGIIAYILKTLQFPYLLTTLSFTLTLYFCNQVIWFYRIDGTLPQVNHELKEQLSKYVGTIKNYRELSKLYNDLKDDYLYRIDYLNIYLRGGILHVDYTPARKNTEIIPTFYNYIAKTDGIIESIHVKKGNVLVHKNQYVKKGDILISNTIIDTQERSKLIETDGEIYAYTCYIKEARYKYYGKETVAYLLYKIRTTLPINVKIDKEKVLDYAIIDNELVLRMQYTCIENIALQEK